VKEALYFLSIKEKEGSLSLLLTIGFDHRVIVFMYKLG
jgi:hypothetical protein